MIIAGVSVTILIALGANSLVNAAAVNDSTAVVSAWTGVVISSTTGGFWINGTDTCDATITRTNADSTTTAITVDSCTVTDTNTLTLAASTISASEYNTIAYTTSLNAFGSVSIWNTTNAVSVTAHVLPILSMNLDTPSITFGELIPGTANTKSVVVTTTSNAKNWITVNTSSTGLATWTTSTDKYIGALVRGASLPTTWTDSYQIASTSAWSGTVITTTDILSSTHNVLSTTNVTDSNTVTTVDFTATVDTFTEAGSYNDTLVFTVTGNY
jgi:hypothetical protein